MMSSVIPARLVFQCGHAALVSLPRIKGETSPQRADRVAREKSDAQTRACDFCAQRLEVVVQAAPAAPPPAPVLTASVPEAPKRVAPPPPAAPVVAPVTVPVAAAPVAAVPVPVAVTPAQPVRHTVAAPKKPVAAAVKKPVGRPRRRPTPALTVPKNGKVARVTAQNGKVARGTRFTVQFQTQTVVRAANVREALRQAQSLGAIEVLAINRES